VAIETFKIPDIGDGEAEVIEITVSEGDTVENEDSLLTLESDKSSMEIPSPASGKVVKILVKEGDQLATGADYIQIETAGAAEAPAAEAPAPSEPAPASSAPAASSASIDVAVPDLDGAEGVEVIEVAVQVGDEIAESDTICTVETDNASMDIPSPASGKVTSVAVKEVIVCLKAMRFVCLRVKVVLHQ